MEDDSLFSERGVSVTKTRVMIGSDTYALSNITSCKVRLRKRVDKAKIKQQNLLAIGSFLVGISAGTILGILVRYMGASRTDAQWCGFILAGFVMVIGLSKAVFLRTKYESHALVFGLSSGEVEAVEDRDAKLIHRIHSAVNRAIIMRG